MKKENILSNSLFHETKKYMEKNG
ncbi:unnamed protein product, partial [Commensalibacter papalotli (ex Botero et al. 2024)]